MLGNYVILPAEGRWLCSPSLESQIRAHLIKGTRESLSWSTNLRGPAQLVAVYLRSKVSCLTTISTYPLLLMNNKTSQIITQSIAQRNQMH